MEQQIQGSNYSEVVYRTEPNPTLISTIVKSSTSTALRPSSHLDTSLPSTSNRFAGSINIVSLTSGHLLKLSTST